MQQQNNCSRWTMLLFAQKTSHEERNFFCSTIPAFLMGILKGARGMKEHKKEVTQEKSNLCCCIG
jgi:hypothetical protein